MGSHTVAERRAGPAVAMVVVGVAAAVIVAGIHLTGSSVDFLAFYTAGKSVLSGHAAQLYDLGWIRAQQRPYSADLMPYLYAPAWALGLAPLAMLPYAWARGLWLLINLSAVALAFHVARAWMATSASRALALLASYAPLIVALVLGQSTGLTLLVCALVSRDEWRGRASFRTGCVASLALYKPNLLLALLLVWLWSRRWGAFLGVLAGAGLVGLASLLVSPAATMEYVQRIPHFAVEVGGDLLRRGATAALLPHLGPFAVPMAAVLVAALVFGWRRGTANADRLSALWLCATVLTPYLGMYDLGLCLLGVSFIRPRGTRDPWIAAGLLLVWVAPFLWFARVLIAPAVSLLVLFFIVVGRTLTVRTTGTATGGDGAPAVTTAVP
jgi:hypothetical protein